MRCQDESHGKGVSQAGRSRDEKGQSAPKKSQPGESSWEAGYFDFAPGLATQDIASCQEAIHLEIPNPRNPWLPNQCCGFVSITFSFSNFSSLGAMTIWQ